MLADPCAGMVVNIAVATGTGEHLLRQVAVACPEPAFRRSRRVVGNVRDPTLGICGHVPGGVGV